MAKLPLIWVKGTKFNDKKLKNTVVVFERHPDHPNGECFVSHDNIKYQVAETARIKQLIGEGWLERVNWNSVVPADPKPTTPKGTKGKAKAKPKTAKPVVSLPTPLPSLDVEDEDVVDSEE